MIQAYLAKLCGIYFNQKTVAWMYTQIEAIQRQFGFITGVFKRLHLYCNLQLGLETTSQFIELDKQGVSLSRT